MEKKPTGAGKSSFDLIDSQKLFAELKLQENTVFLDVACGKGAYSLAATKYIGSSGRIYAFDLWREGIELLQKQISEIQANTIQAKVVDVSERIPLEDQSADVCLVATVLHDFIQDRTDQAVLRELKRVLKHRATLAVLEFKKIEGPPGPPLTVRISPEQVEEHLRPFSFELIKTMDIGDFNYVSLFAAK